MLTGKQKRYLRSLANPLEAIYQVGKGGVNPAFIQGISEALEARELIKISVLKNCAEEKAVLAETIAKQTNSDVVQIIGSTIILYKESEEKKKIELPK